MHGTFVSTTLIATLALFAPLARALSVHVSQPGGCGDFHVVYGGTPDLELSVLPSDNSCEAEPIKTWTSPSSPANITWTPSPDLVGKSVVFVVDQNVGKGSTDGNDAWSNDFTVGGPCPGTPGSTDSANNGTTPSGDGSNPGDNGGAAANVENTGAGVRFIPNTNAVAALAFVALAIFQL